MSDSDEDKKTEEAKDSDGDLDEDLAPDTADEQEPDAPAPAAPAVSHTRWIAAALAALFAISAGLSGWLYFAVFRGDEQVGPETEQAVLAAAADGTTAVLTYSPKTLENDFAAAESHLTGNFLSYYTDFTQKIVTPAAKEKDVQTVASVVRKGLVTLHPKSAEVLVFVNQTTVSRTNPDGSFSMSSVKVGLEKHDGRWLISSFDPV